MKYLFIVLFLFGCDSQEVNEPTEAVKISHRGYDENKLGGFKAAINDNYTILEADIRLRGGIPVLIHDDIDCGNCDALESLLMLASDNGVTLFLEFKERAAIDLSLDLINQYNVDVVLTSFSYNDLIYINSVSNYSLGYISGGGVDWDKLPIIDYLIINQNHIDECVAMVKCVAWTITNQEQHDKISHKVDYVIEDRY